MWISCQQVDGGGGLKELIYSLGVEAGVILLNLHKISLLKKSIKKKKKEKKKKHIYTHIKNPLKRKQSKPYPSNTK